MSRWATDPSASVSDGSASGSPPAGKPDAGLRRVPAWAKLVPFFFSAILFLSAVFALFSPLPILFAFFRRGRLQAYACAAVNTGVVGLLAGGPSLVLYLIFVVAVALILAETLEATRSIDRAGAAALLGVFLLVGGGWLAQSHTNFHPFTQLQAEISHWTDVVVQSVPEGREALVGHGLPSDSTPEEIAQWRAALLAELPSAVGVFVLILIWTNLSTLLRANVGGVRQRLGIRADFFQTWRSPEYLVWPTLFAGAFLIFEVKPISIVAINLFKILMTVYALQGLSILSFAFGAWGLRGLWRTVAYGVAVFLAMPLLLSLGFFDLWFDFRSRIRQT